MAIYIPGKRDRHGKLAGMKQRAVVNLSLTALIDMFVILVIFLLQSYKSTGEIIQIPKGVELPKAGQTKELRPAHIVTLTQEEVLFDKDVVGRLEDIKNQKDWMIPALRAMVVEAMARDEQTLKSRIKNALPGQKPETDQNAALTEENKRKITISADKKTDFLTIKKIMYTVSEAGMSEINFAVQEDRRREDAAEVEI